jgi:hypothetical protein
MNDRITQLAEQAGLGVIHNGIVLTKNVNAAEAFEQFAQSIVQECASMVDLHGRWVLYDKLAVKIKKHFGVEE